MISDEFVLAILPFISFLMVFGGGVAGYFAAKTGRSKK